MGERLVPAIERFERARQADVRGRVGRVDAQRGLEPSSGVGRRLGLVERAEEVGPAEVLGVELRRPLISGARRLRVAMRVEGHAVTAPGLAVVGRRLERAVEAGDLRRHAGLGAGEVR